MQLFASAILISSLLAVSYAAPANEPALVPRQTYTITCIGSGCDDGSTPTPTAKPTTSKKPPVVPTPTKTTTGEEVGPSSTRCPVPLYYKCGGWDGGAPWAGCTVCVKGAKCVVQNEWYYQCVADDSLVEELGTNSTTSEH